MSEKVNR